MNPTAPVFKVDMPTIPPCFGNVPPAGIGEAGPKKERVFRVEGLPRQTGAWANVGQTQIEEAIRRAFGINTHNKLSPPMCADDGLCSAALLVDADQAVMVTTNSFNLVSRLTPSPWPTRISLVVTRTVIHAELGGDAHFVQQDAASSCQKWIGCDRSTAVVSDGSPSISFDDHSPAEIVNWALRCCTSATDVADVIPLAAASECLATPSQAAHVLASPNAPTPVQPPPARTSVPCTYIRPGYVTLSSRACLAQGGSALTPAGHNTLAINSATFTYQQDSRWPRINCGGEYANHYVTPFVDEEELHAWNGQCCGSNDDVKKLITQIKLCVKETAYPADRFKDAVASDTPAAPAHTEHGSDQEQCTDCGKALQACDAGFHCAHDSNPMRVSHHATATRVYVPMVYLPYAYHKTQAFGAELYQRFTSVMSEQRQQAMLKLGVQTFLVKKDANRTKEQIFLAFVPAMNYQVPQMPGNDNITGGAGNDVLVGDNVHVNTRLGTNFATSNKDLLELADFAVESMSQNLLRLSTLAKDAYTYETDVIGGSTLNKLLRFGNDRITGSTGTDLVIGDTLCVLVPTVQQNYHIAHDIDRLLAVNFYSYLLLSHNLDVALYEIQTAMLTAMLASEASVEVSGNIEISVEMSNDEVVPGENSQSTVIVLDHLTISQASDNRTVVPCTRHNRDETCTWAKITKASLGSCWEPTAPIRSSYNDLVRNRSAQVPRTRAEAENELRIHVMNSLQPVSGDLGASVNRIPDAKSEVVFGNDKLRIGNDSTVITGNAGIVLPYKGGDATLACQAKLDEDAGFTTLNTSRGLEGAVYGPPAPRLWSPMQMMVFPRKATVPREAMYSSKRVTRLNLYSCRAGICATSGSSFSLSDTMVVDGGNNAIVATDYGIELSHPPIPQCVKHFTSFEKSEEITDKNIRNRNISFAKTSGDPGSQPVPFTAAQGARCSHTDPRHGPKANGVCGQFMFRTDYAYLNKTSDEASSSALRNLDSFGLKRRRSTAGVDGFSVASGSGSDADGNHSSGSGSNISSSVVATLSIGLGLVDVAGMSDVETVAFGVKLQIALVAASPTLSVTDIESIIIRAVSTRSRARRGAVEAEAVVEFKGTVKVADAAQILGEVNKAITDNAFAIGPFNVNGAAVTVTITATAQIGERVVDTSTALPLVSTVAADPGVGGAVERPALTHVGANWTGVFESNVFVAGGNAIKWRFSGQGGYIGLKYNGVTVLRAYPNHASTTLKEGRFTAAEMYSFAQHNVSIVLVDDVATGAYGYIAVDDITEDCSHVRGIPDIVEAASCGALSDYLVGNNALGNNRGASSFTVNNLHNDILLPENKNAQIICNGTVAGNVSHPQCQNAAELPRGVHADYSAATSKIGQRVWDLLHQSPHIGKWTNVRNDGDDLDFCFLDPVSFPGQVTQRCHLPTEDLFGVYVGNDKTYTVLAEDFGHPYRPGGPDSLHPRAGDVDYLNKNMIEQVTDLFSAVLDAQVQALIEVSSTCYDHGLYVFVAFDDYGKPIEGHDVIRIMSERRERFETEILTGHELMLALTEPTTTTTSSSSSSSTSTTSSRNSTSTSSTTTTSTSTTSTTSTSTSSTTSTVKETKKKKPIPTFEQVQGRSGCCRPSSLPKRHHTANTQAECQNMCERDNSCSSYEFTDFRKRCEIYSAVVTWVLPSNLCQCWAKTSATTATRRATTTVSTSTRQTTTTTTRKTTSTSVTSASTRAASTTTTRRPTTSSTTTTAHRSMFKQVQGRGGCCRPSNLPKRDEHADTQAECQDICDRDNACSSYEFTDFRKRCEIYSAVVTWVLPSNLCQCWAKTSATTATRRATTTVSTSTRQTTTTTTRKTTSTSVTSASTRAASTTTTRRPATRSTTTTAHRSMFKQVQGRGGCCRPSNLPHRDEHAGTQAECQDICDRDNACSSYEFTDFRKRCEIYSAVVTWVLPSNLCQCWVKTPDTTATRRATTTVSTSKSRGHATKTTQESAGAVEAGNAFFDCLEQLDILVDSGKPKRVFLKVKKCFRIGNSVDMPKSDIRDAVCEALGDDLYQQLKTDIEKL